MNLNLQLLKGTEVMKRTRRVEQLLVLVVALVSVIVFTLPNQSANATMASCATCENNCYEDAWNWQTGTYATCSDSGGSNSQCTAAAIADYNACTMICNYQGCNIPYMK